ncbi:MAG TPA: pitrilysin family protein [Candidatus Babeliales bacterium]|nr:pitrilysin family protein [Candidatus Babeliales bacterium]
MERTQEKIVKKVLSNGLTVLVHPNRQVPKVSTQLWYHVGSKDEQTGERGLAHLLEHMIFKGTEKLSESDINVITSKLSGSTNAFTSYDYTGYLFDMPSQHWQEAFKLFADCMINCTFKEDLLNSELKAVIQELKMYKDNYTSSLIEDMIGTIFADHPYHNPIIGYKQDLWNITREGLLKFYNKHYIPNNATLIVVGDVDPEVVFEEAQKEFGSIQPVLDYKREEFYYNKDLSAKSITLYRDVSQPFGAGCFVIPGAIEKKDFIFDVISWLLGAGRGSVLYKKLVDELDLITDIDAFSYDLFDQGLFFIDFQPKKAEDIPKIFAVIQDEIARLVQDGISDEDLERAIKKSESTYLSSMESNQKVAYALGRMFVATGDENYVFDYVEKDKDKVREQVESILKQYFNPMLLNTGIILPIEEDQRDKWEELQQISDELDTNVLAGKTRQTAVEEQKMAFSVHPKAPKHFEYPIYQEFTLDNGLEVLMYNNPGIPKIEMFLEMKAKHHYDPENQQGLGNFVSEMLEEGTKRHTAEQLAYEVESRGMTISTSPGYVTMGLLSEDFSKALDILAEVLTEPAFDEKSIIQVRDRITADINNYWDSPSQFVGSLINKEIYKDHPYHKGLLGTLDTIKNFDRATLVDHYKKTITPNQARLVVVGDLSNIDVQKQVEQHLGKWQGPEVADLDYCALDNISQHDINYPINRDQVVLSFAGLSVSRLHPDFDKLLLFEQIFSGGVLGSMSSRLFALREQTGLFYTITGSLIARADKQPGISFVKTIVSLDRLAEAEKVIAETINKAPLYIEDEEFSQARNALANSLVDNFATSRQIAQAFLFLKQYNLPKNYFDYRSEQLMGIEADEVRQAAMKVLNTNQMVKVRVGRV